MSRVMKSLGLEAISFKNGKSDLFKELTEEVGRIRAAKVFTDTAIKRSRIDCIIKNHTGIGTLWGLDASEELDAYVNCPDINVNHPFLVDYQRAFASGATLSDLLKVTKSSKLEACVDRVKGKVYGAYTQITSPAFISKGFLTEETLSDESIAAIILHEVGHLFTFFEYMPGTVTLNYATATAINDIQKTASDVERIEILSKLEDIIDVPLDNKEFIIKQTDKGIMTSMVLGTVFREKRDETGTPIYSYNACEFVADQFAIRHGAGLDLALTLDATHIRYNTVERGTVFASTIGSLLGGLQCFLITGGIFTGFWLLSTGVPIVALFGGAVWATGLMAVSIFLKGEIGDNYDTPKDRFARMIREYNAALKNPKIKDKARQYYLDQLEGLYRLEKNYNNVHDWFTMYWEYCAPAGRRSKKEAEFQQAIEKMTNNSLYASSASFKQLGA